MIKTFLMKTLTVGLLVVGSSCIEVNAQQTVSGRKLEIVSFAEADKSDFDFDVDKSSNFSGKLSNSALVKVFMPGEVESTDPIPSKPIERKLSPVDGGYANYIWIESVEQHCNSLRIVPKGNLYQSLRVNFTEYGISKYNVRSKKGGLQAGKVYRLVLRDPAPVLIDTQLPGAYAVINGDTKKY